MYAVRLIQLRLIRMRLDSTSVGVAYLHYSNLFGNLLKRRETQSHVDGRPYDKSASMKFNNSRNFEKKIRFNINFFIMPSLRNPGAFRLRGSETETSTRDQSLKVSQSLAADLARRVSLLSLYIPYRTLQTLKRKALTQKYQIRPRFVLNTITLLP
jgi:hypothetical protein